MKFKDLYNFPKKPGIYYFKNTVNGKYYIGQAQEIRKRVLKHKTNFESGYYPDTHLYRAWKRHGIEIFEVGILEIVDLPKSEERNRKLDELEKMYIEQFNSYGTSGYNQTLGGDGGIDGYKYTESQRKRASINTLIDSISGRNRRYFYDTITHQYGETPSFQLINDIFNKNSRYRPEQICYFGRYIFAKTKQELEKKKNIFFSSAYNYPNNDIDYDTKDLQKLIDNRVSRLRKEIEEFFEKYGRAKYNRKDNKSKKEYLNNLRKEDLESGITREDYMEKYNIKSKEIFYNHVHKLCPNWTEPDGEHIDMTNEMREDILNGLGCSKFIRKYNISESNFYRFRYLLEDELGVEVLSLNPGKNCDYVSEEQEKDILNGMNTFEYMRKYNVCEGTFHIHTKYVSEKHPNFKYKPIKNNKKTDIELIRKDIENGISLQDFSIKYELSKSTYKKYKRIILKDSKK